MNRKCKRDAETKGADYSYDIARRLTERKWARSVGGNRLSTTYAYNAFGQLETTNYSDTTPDLSITYDRLGRTYSVGNGVAGSIYTYDSSTLLLDTETISYDLNGDTTADFTRVLDRSQDAYLHPSGWQLKDGTTVENEVEYRYDSAGRFGEIESPAGVFTYGYTPGSNLVGMVAGPAHSVTNTWEPNRDVLSLKENKVGSTVVSSYGYSVNAIGQRAAVSQQGTAFASSRTWDWAYDALGQVTSADHSTDNTFDRAYQYDAIGNRRFSELTNTQISNPPVANTTAYTPNVLNQYTTVGSLNPVHDEDGNATSYPLPADPGDLSSLVWDGENRLISATVNDTTTTYLYDGFSRRVGKTTGSNTTLFVYDGWNSIAEYSYSPLNAPSSTLTKSQTWGLDLSGTLQGAGGVGGFLAESQISNSLITHYFPTYDGNGNASEYLTSAGAVAAHFEYDPFGNTVANTDTTGLFTYRFSTKPLDFETGLYYYGYRYYDPQTGRWLNRDPLKELGGFNLYHFCFNHPLGATDYLGLNTATWGALPRAASQGSKAGARGGPLSAAAGAFVGIIVVEVPMAIEAYREMREAQRAAEEAKRAAEEAQRKLDDLIKNPPIPDICPSLPLEGIPGSTVGEKGQTRRYGPDGYPETDRDAPHGGGKPIERGDHAHDWGRPEGGGKPSHEDRGPARPPIPGDPPAPPGYGKP